jgi:hypothetical protein
MPKKSFDFPKHSIEAVLKVPQAFRRQERRQPAPPDRCSFGHRYESWE